MKQTFQSRIASLFMAVVLLFSLAPNLYATSDNTSPSIKNINQPDTPITNLVDQMVLGISGLPGNADDYTYQWLRTHSDTLNPQSFVEIKGENQKQYTFTASLENSQVYIACEYTRKGDNSDPKLVILNVKSPKQFAPTPAALTAADISKTATSIQITNQEITKTPTKYRIRKKVSGSDNFTNVYEGNNPDFLNLTPNTIYAVSYHILEDNYIGSSPWAPDFEVTTETAFAKQPYMAVTTPITSANTDLNQVSQGVQYQVKDGISVENIFIIPENDNPANDLNNVSIKINKATGLFKVTPETLPNGTYKVGIKLRGNRFSFSDNFAVNWNAKISFDGTIQIVGQPIVNSTLTAISDSLIVTSDILEYQWYHAPDTVIENATSGSYTVKESDLGKTLLCKVKIKTSQHTIFAETEKSSAPTSKVSKAPSAPIPPYIPEKVEDTDAKDKNDKANEGKDSQVKDNGNDNTGFVSTVFTDIVKDSWYEKSVQFVFEKGLMNGIRKDNFAPEENASRGQIATILYRLAGSPMVEGSASFQDVMTNDYFANAVAWATQNKIASGYNSSVFGANDAISREQLAVFLYRMAQKNGVTLESSFLESFTDKDMVSDYAKEALNWAIAKDLINGVGNQMLNPKGNATRSQIATILMRYTELVK